MGLPVGTANGCRPAWPPACAGAFPPPAPREGAFTDLHFIFLHNFKLDSSLALVLPTSRGPEFSSPLSVSSAFFAIPFIACN